MISNIDDRRKGTVIPHNNPKSGQHFVIEKQGSITKIPADLISTGNRDRSASKGLVQSHSTSQLQEVSVPIVEVRKAVKKRNNNI